MPDYTPKFSDEDIRKAVAAAVAERRGAPETVVRNDLDRIRRAFERKGEIELFEKYAHLWAPLLEWNNRQVHEAIRTPEDQAQTARDLRLDAERGQSFQGAVDPAELAGRPWRGAWYGASRGLMGPGEPVPNDLAEAGSQAKLRARDALAAAAVRELSADERIRRFFDDPDLRDSALARVLYEGRAGVDDILRQTGNKPLFKPTEN